MSKKQIFIIMILLHSSVFTQLDLLSFLKKFSPQPTAQLSANQIFQLNYLQEELKDNAALILNYWTQNEDARIIIERTELAVQQSDSSTQALIKQRIIQLFQDSGIDILFTPENHIQIINNNLKIDKSDDQSDTHRHAKPKKATSQSNIEQPHKIHGANRTRKQLERSWNQRQEALRHAELIQRAQNSQYKETLQDISNAELFKEGIKARLEHQQKSTNFEKTYDQLDSHDDGL